MQRCVQPEWLDQLPAEAPSALLSRRDLRRLNAWMGHVGLMLRALRQAFPERPPRRLVDLGAGDGSFMLQLARRLGPPWQGVSVTLVERQRIIRPELTAAFSQLGWRLDIVQAEAGEWVSQSGLPPCELMLANLFLHHFSPAQLSTLLAACASNTSTFIALEPRRSALALVASRLVALIGCNAVTRHDAPISVRAGFAADELSELWPADGSWERTEQACGLFSHLFVAHLGRGGGVRATKEMSRTTRGQAVPAPNQLSRTARGQAVPAPKKLNSTARGQAVPAPALKPLTIIGGGLAGLTLAIGLRQRGIPVTVWEAGHYPRHRVCGEFISGRGQEVLHNLGLWEAFLRAGATLARTAAFFLGPAHTPVRQLPAPALCLSRFVMDDLLASHFLALGGQLRTDSRWRDPELAEGLVRASGRRSQVSQPRWRWFGLKVHARNVPLLADLEMHGQHNGYVGVCRLNAEEVNICGIFRRRAGAHEPPRPWQEILRGDPGTSLHARLAGAVFDESSFCSVAGLSLVPVRAATLQECCLGDALTMIPPVTGNGMSMAFEAAGLALEPLTAYSRGETSWAEARRAVGRACDQRFRQRLAWAQWLHWMMFTPLLRTPLGTGLLRSERLWRLLFSKTR